MIPIFASGYYYICVITLFLSQIFEFFSRELFERNLNFPLNNFLLLHPSNGATTHFVIKERDHNQILAPPSAKIGTRVPLQQILHRFSILNKDEKPDHCSCFGQTDPNGINRKW